MLEVINWGIFISSVRVENLTNVFAFILSFNFVFKVSNTKNNIFRSKQSFNNKIVDDINEIIQQMKQPDVFGNFREIFCDVISITTDFSEFFKNRCLLIKISSEKVISYFATVSCEYLISNFRSR